MISERLRTLKTQIKMETIEYNALAKKLSSIIDYKGLTKYLIRTYKGDSNDAIIKDRKKIVDRCTRKVNAFCDYAKEKGCTWEDFEKEYYGHNKDDKKIEETKPKKE